MILVPSWGVEDVGSIASQPAKTQIMSTELVTALAGVDLDGAGPGPELPIRLTETGALGNVEIAAR
jgi:hypothetical protein